MLLLLAREPLPQAGADDFAPLFKAVADPMRLRLLSLIACHDGGESCVCDLLEALNVTAPSVSYHLKILREAGLISTSRWTATLTTGRGQRASLSLGRSPRLR